jgi:ABC-2 type transport system permease protein
MRVWLAQPVAVISPIFTAVFMFFMFAAPLSEITRLPNFPTGDYDAFLTGMILVMAMVFSGSDMAMVVLADILSGYLDKLLLAPIHRFSILLGILLVAATRALAQVLVIVGLALALGVRFDTGPVGLLAVVVGTTVFGVAFSCLGIVIALRTKSTQVTMSTWLLFMPFAFITTAFMPKDLLTGWFKVAVTVNPVDYVLVGVRAIIIQGWEWDAILPGMFWLTGLTIALLTAAAWSFRRATA